MELFGATHLSTGSALAIFAGLYIAYSILYAFVASLSAQSKYLRSQPWIGLKAKWFAKYRAGMASITGTRDFLFEGYESFSKNNQLFAIPSFATKPWVLIPPTKIRELLAKPDDEVDLRGVLKEMVASYWTGDEDIAGSGIHLDVIRQQLTRKLELFTEDIHVELEQGFQEHWNAGKDKWLAVTGLDTCMKIVSRAANRVFSGVELCRNEEYLERTRLYSQGIFTIAGLINLMPSWLRPLLAPPMVQLNRRHLAVCKKTAVPEIKRRLERIQSGSEKEPETDALTWIIENAINTGDPAEINPDKICRRLVRLNMVAIHTTSITITNALLDLFGSARAQDFVDGLREECYRVLAEHGGEWTKAAVSDLVRVDSTIKESMRFSSLAMVGVMREVVKEDGIDLGDGIHLPKGVRIGAANVAIHRDPVYYPNPDDLDEKSQVLEKRNQAIVTTGENFIAFGHGRDACPGRFFASQEMKLMLAYIVMNYDVKLPGPRPQSIDIKISSVPPPTAQFLVRRRQ
ncbi:hypothetical protein M409DRAFT_61895 [Zasmidium cellare ATCC 36951]|uniref:Cytochrome P450 n=1 Tax=Zasmidium cellare ATCC 36951 TaxID=1080233 RepID=A0A6A6D327_ZASCE|nr:uncharacterized protein M409DRAFT_61895 [Zasmidium cellare ATCC 36951]KAF2173523.1 hypothetical protein M409DRAFT_61895 [Zasmidium cellare ATCC 36951]